MDEEARNNLNELINSYETLTDDIAREKSQLSAHRVPNDKVLAWRLRINYISQKALNHKVFFLSSSICNSTGDALGAKQEVNMVFHLGPHFV